VQACEEADPDGRFLTRTERERASRSAREVAPRTSPEPPDDAVERLLVARADILTAALESHWPGLRLARSLVLLHVPRVAIVALAVIGGVLYDRLGDTRRINLLAFPLLGLLAWNLAVYAAAAIRRWWPPLYPYHRARAVVRAIIAVVARGRWLGDVEASRWLAAAMRGFTRHWVLTASHVTQARGARLLHLAAASFAVGAVLGMYVRGLAFEYRAGWESTFLDARAVRGLLQIVLGPAAAFVHAVWPAAVPPPAELFSVVNIQRLQGPAADGEAAVWIHLWAVTIAALVVAPRLALAWRAGRRERRLAARLTPPLDDPYYLRLLAADRGGGTWIDVVPYGYRPSARAAEDVDALLLDLFGSRARIRRAAPVGYGENVELAPEPSAAVALLFNLAQSPEPEVHGALIDALRRDADRTGTSLLLVLDEEPYRTRLGAEAPRLAERRRAWERLAADAGLGVVSLPGPDVDALATARAVLHPGARAIG